MEKVISYEVAQVLNKIGFDRNVSHWYTQDKRLHNSPTAGNEFHGSQGCPAPTQDQLKNWLWSEHEIFIEIRLDVLFDPSQLLKEEKAVPIFHFTSRTKSRKEGWQWGSSRIMQGENFHNYHTALEYALKTALEWLAKQQEPPKEGEKVVG